MARRGAEFWRRHLEAFYQGDLTQKEYCVTHSLSERTFYRWHNKEKDMIAAAKSTLTLVPVNVGGGIAERVVSLHSPSGWRLDVARSDVRWLAELLKHLP